jgi:hypothetical protein
MSTATSATWAANVDCWYFLASLHSKATCHSFAKLHARRVDPAVEHLPPHCPPEPDDTGKLDSPSRTVTFSIGTPSISAAVWAMIV